MIDMTIGIDLGLQGTCPSLPQSLCVFSHYQTTSTPNLTQLSPSHQAATAANPNAPNIFIPSATIIVGAAIAELELVVAAAPLAELAAELADEDTALVADATLSVVPNAGSPTVPLTLSEPALPVASAGGPVRVVARLSVELLAPPTLPQ